MNYENYSVHDFVKDELFYKWVLHPEPDTDHFWKTWIKAHPEQQNTVDKARLIIQNINYKTRYEMDSTSYARIFESMMRHKKTQDVVLKDRRSLKRNVGWWSAAAVVLLALVSSALFTY